MRKRIVPVLIALLICSIPTFAFAQGEFILGNESIVGAQVSGYMGPDDATGGTATFGYSLRGIVDFSAAAGSMAMGGSNKGFAGLGVTLWPIKKKRNQSDFSIGLFGEVAVASSFKAYTGGVILPLQFPASSSTMLVASIGAGLTSVDLKSYWGDHSYGFGLMDFSVVYPTGPTSKMALSLNVTMVEQGENTIGASLALLFGWSRPPNRDDF